MEMKIVIVTRNGVEKMRIAAEVRNGVLQTGGGNILLNSDLITKSGMSQAHILKEIKAHRISPKIEAMGMKIGENGNGLVVRWAEDIQREKREAAATAYNALPVAERAAREERAMIEDLYARAERALSHDTDGENIPRGYRLRAEADRKLRAWREKYPIAIRQEQAEGLQEQAERREELAKGALLFDADGWIDSGEQQKRHDDLMSEAQGLRAEAAKLSRLVD